MNELESPRHKLTLPQRMEVLALIARGDNYKKVNAHLDKKYGVTITPPMITYLKKRHADTLEMMQSQIAQHQLAEAEVLMDKSRKLLSKKLDRAAEDFDEIAELDRQYRNGEIEAKDWIDQKKALMKVSISELNQVSKDMYAQTKDLPTDPNKPSTPAEQASADDIIAALQSGDTIEMQRIIFK